MTSPPPQEWEIFPRKHYDEYRVGVVYPAAYRVAMSNLGFQWLIRRIESVAGFAVERFFPAEGPQGRPVSLESGAVPMDCHVLAFSVSIESDYPAVVRFLQTAGLPSFSGERDNRYPLVIAGGAALQVNPEPLAPFVDIIFPGEGEGGLDRFLSAYQAAGDRGALLDALAGQPYVYVPERIDVDYGTDGGVRHIRPRSAGAAGDLSVWRGVPVPPIPQGELEVTEPPFNNIVATDTEFADTLLVEIARGCPMGCRYCWAGARYRPLRTFSVPAILALARRARSGVRKIGLVSTAVCQHPGLAELMESLRAMGYAVGVSSLRLSDLTPEMLDFLVAGGEDAITLAPETGSDRLRRVINKGFDNTEILAGCRQALTAGIRKIKYYLMVGLPTETDGDLEATAALVRDTRALLDEMQVAWGVPGRLTVSINPFVPKPNTPFQFAPMAPAGELKRKLRRLGRELGRLQGVEVHTGSVREAVLQWTLAYGTRDMAPDLDALAAGRIGEKEFLARAKIWTGQNNPDSRPPWTVMDWGLSSSFLQREWRRAHEGRLGAPCPGGTDCRACGICP